MCKGSRQYEVPQSSSLETVPIYIVDGDGLLRAGELQYNAEEYSIDEERHELILEAEDYQKRLPSKVRKSNHALKCPHKHTGYIVDKDIQEVTRMSSDSAEEGDHPQWGNENQCTGCGVQ